MTLRGDWNHPLVTDKRFPFKIAQPNWKGGWGSFTFNFGLRRKSDWRPSVPMERPQAMERTASATRWTSEAVRLAGICHRRPTGSLRAYRWRPLTGHRADTGTATKGSDSCSGLSQVQFTAPGNPPRALLTTKRMPGAQAGTAPTFTSAASTPAFRPFVKRGRAMSRRTRTAR